MKKDDLSNVTSRQEHSLSSPRSICNNSGDSYYELWFKDLFAHHPMFKIVPATVLAGLLSGIIAVIGAFFRQRTAARMRILHIRSRFAVVIEYKAYHRVRAACAAVSRRTFAHSAEITLAADVGNAISKDVAFDVAAQVLRGEIPHIGHDEEKVFLILFSL